MVEKRGQRSQNRRSPSPQTASHLSSPPQESLPSSSDYQTVREEEDQCTAGSQHEDTDHFGTKHHLDNFYRIHDIASTPALDVAETLFFDESANIQDFPEDLDWFFEESQPGIFSTMGLQPAPTFPEPVTIPAFLNFHQPILSPSPSTYDVEWTVARANILASLSSLPPDLLESSFFRPDNMAMLYVLYFKNYHHHFPILHQPTLIVSEAPPLLLTAILTLGATLATDPAFYYLGQRIHDALRWIILATGKFEPLSPLWCLQALLLVQAQGKMFSTTKHHEMAHIFHGAILTMMKRGRAYSTISNFGSNQPTSLEIGWRQWAEDESSRRTAFFAFIMDAQHASVFGHNPVLSVSDMRLPLPCADALWECNTPEQWQSLTLQAPKPPQFLPTLKALIGKSFVPPACSDFSRFILLHGLLSLTTHLQARDNTTLGIGVRKLAQRETPTPPPPQVEDWKDIMSTAIETWSFCLLSLEPSLCLEAAQPLHRMAFITLHTNITDLHILAKDVSSRETQLLRKEFSKAETRTRDWSRRDEAKEAVDHSLLLVKETVFTGRRYRAREDNIALRPWCLYHAILVLWAFGLMTEGPSDELIGAEEYVVRILSAVQRGKGSITGANKTRGLISAIADALGGCRWELLEEAYLTLRRLSGLHRQQ